MNTLLLLTQIENLTSEKEIVTLAEKFVEFFLEESDSLNCLLIQRKLDKLSEAIKGLVEEKAYGQITGKEIDVNGIKVSVTQPKPVYTFSENYYQLENSFKAEADKNKAILKANATIEIQTGEAIAESMQKGQIKVSFRKD